MTDIKNSIWAKELAAELKNVRDASITQDKIDILIQEFASIIEPYISAEQHNKALNQICAISSQISALKNEISNIGSNILEESFIPEISLELHSVITQTEQSVIGILDVADELEKISHKVSTAEIRSELLAHSTKILELCNFQDLTGQMLQRIIKRLNIIESTIDIIIAKFGDQDCIKYTCPITTDSLLNGPQKEADRPSQNEIDDLFNSLK